MTPDRYRWFVVFVMWLMHLVYFITYSSVGVLGPVLKQDLGLTNAQFGVLCGAVGVGTTSFQLPGGIWADRVGVKKVIMLSFLGIAGCCLAFSWTWSLSFGIVVLFMLGSVVACTQVSATKAIVDWFPYGGRATAMGMKQTGVNAGGILGSLLLPFVTTLYGWRLPYRLMAVAALLFALFIALVYRDAERRVTSRAVARSWLSEALFALRQPHFLLVTVVGVFLIAAQFAFSSYLVIYLNQSLQFSLGVSGSVLALSFATGAAGRIGWGAASDYFIKNRQLTLALVGAFGGILCLALCAATPSTPIWVVYLLAGLSGLTLLGYNGVWFTLVGELSQGSSSGLLIGICFLFANLGLLFGPPVFGFLADYFHSFLVSWIFLTATMALVTFLMLLDMRVLARTPAGGE